MSGARGRGTDASRPAVLDALADCDLDDAFDASDPPPGTTSHGGQYLVDLADVLRGAGLAVREVDGWQQRARDSGGYRQEGPVAIIVHHTASSSAKDGRGDVDEQAFGCAVAPMANLYLDRSGGWWVMAAGATNTNGKGGPLGPLPKDSANSRVIGIEAGNNGIGEPWPEATQASYVAGVAALAERYGIATANVFAHHEWSPGRKIDPAGPSRFGSVNRHGSWDMAQFRAAVGASRGAPPTPTEPAPVEPPPVDPPPVPPSGATYVVRPGDSWWSIAAALLGDPAETWPLLAAANGGADRLLRTGDVLSVPGEPPVEDPGGGIPAYPGGAEMGDRGPVVLAWQQALIANGVISDSAANTDSSYGKGMRKAVFELQRSWGWDDADGRAGEHTWSKLHGGP